MIELAGIKNIIFDFGGVIYNIDPQRTVDAFKKLGESDLSFNLYEYIHHDVFGAFEKGALSANEFYDGIRKFYKMPISNEEIHNAWISLLISYSKDRILLLEKLKLSHRTFLLSNTNIIHYNTFTNHLKKGYGYNSLDDLFEKAYYSFRLMMAKPDKEIYELVLSENNLTASETLFIDDNKENIEAAHKLGIKTHHLIVGKEDLAEIFA